MRYLFATLASMASFLGLALLAIFGAILDRWKSTHTPMADFRVAVKDVDGPTSYVQGTGTLLQASDFGLSVITFVVVSNPVVKANNNTTHYLDWWLRSPAQGSAQNGSGNVRLLWSVFATGAEVAGGVDLSGQSFVITAYGY